MKFVLFWHLALTAGGAAARAAILLFSLAAADQNKNTVGSDQYQYHYGSRFHHIITWVFVTAKASFHKKLSNVLQSICIFSGA